MKTIIYKRKNNCRLCNSSNLTSVLKLASTPPANAFVTKDKLHINQEKFPLELFFCEECYHLQLTDVVDPNELFENYVYVSGTSPVFIDHFYNYAKDIINTYKPSLKNYILDIGSNDGTLLKFFKEEGYSVIGVDPAKNFRFIHKKRKLKVIYDHFGKNFLNKKNEKYFDIIIGINVFAHFKKVSESFKTINKLLNDEGRFLFEVAYALPTLFSGNFDTVSR